MNIASKEPIAIVIPASEESSSKEVAENGQRTGVPSDFKSWTAAIAQGDETAFRTFFDAYNVRLWRLAMLLSRGNETLAKEIHQTTMIKAARSFRPFEKECQLWAWLSKIARNSWVDLVRKESFLSRILALSSPSPEEQPPVDSMGPLLKHLDTALAALEPGDLAMVQQIYFHKMGQAEVAAELETTVKSVERKIHRIRQQLRNALLKALTDE